MRSLTDDLNWLILKCVHFIVIFGVVNKENLIITHLTYSTVCRKIFKCLVCHGLSYGVMYIEGEFDESGHWMDFCSDHSQDIIKPKITTMIVKYSQFYDLCSKV